MRYPDYKTYELLYAKYINQENLESMMDFAEDYKNKVFLDICCGNCSASKEALKRGSKLCILIDKEKNMVPQELWNTTESSIFFNLPITQVSRYFIKDTYFIHNKIKNNKKIDIAFCRQGINYWFSYINIKAIAQIIKKDGIFIFNTFNQKPTKKPMIKEYKINNINFCEISYLINNSNVYHIQIREGFSPHMTKFYWFDKKDYFTILNDFFEVSIIKKNKTDIYKCIRK